MNITAKPQAYGLHALQHNMFTQAPTCGGIILSFIAETHLHDFEQEPLEKLMMDKKVRRELPWLS